MDNFLKKFDNLSGKIELKFKGKDGYKNVLGGSLTLLVYILTFTTALLFSINLIERIDPKSYTVKKYIESGVAKMDQNNLFHFLAIWDLTTAKPLDLKKYEDILSVNAYVTIANGSHLIRYTYDNCLLEDFSGIETHYTDMVSESYYCIREMKDQRNDNSINKTNRNLDWISNVIELSTNTNFSYNNNNDNNNLENNYSKNNSSEIKRYKLNKEFIYPWMTIEKSDDIKNIKYFKIEVTECRNTTDKNSFCKPKEEIDEKISNLVLQLKFIDNMFDVGNYKEPITKYTNNKQVAMKKNTLSNLYLNFIAVNIITRDGLILDDEKRIESYAFDFNSEAFTATKGNLIQETHFWISNNAQNYERSYPKLQNVLAEVTGLYRFFFIIGSILNYIFEKYINFTINDNLTKLLNVIMGDEKLHFNEIEHLFQKKIENFKQSKSQLEVKESFKGKSKKEYSKNNEIGFAKDNTTFPMKILINKQTNLFNKQFNDKNDNDNDNKILSMKSSNFDNKSNNNFNLPNTIKIGTKLHHNLNEEKSQNENGHNHEKKNKIHYINKQKTILKKNSNVNNHDTNKNFSSFNLLDRNEERNFEIKNLEKSKIDKAENHTIVNFKNGCSHSHDSDFNLNKKSTIGKRVKFFKFVCYYLKCRLSSNVSYGIKLRDILLDEINIYRLHLDLIKIKKIIKEEVLVNRDFNSIGITFRDILRNY